MEKIKYPRPQFIRENWLDLNGQWQFTFDDQNIGENNNNYLNDNFYNMNIEVPYSYHTKNSGINLNENHPIVWYKKDIHIDVKEDKSYILHFGAVDYKCDLYINDKHIFTHIGGHTPFEVDITKYIQQDFSLIIRAEDYNLTTQPIGKQSWKKTNFLCWYTRTVGIWQSVWMEETGKTYLTDVRMTPDIDNASLDIDAYINNDNQDVWLKGEVYYEGELITRFMSSFKSKRARFTIDVSDEESDFRLHFWHPNSPNLYDIHFTLVSKHKILDDIQSYFGMRRINYLGNKVYLNNQEFYQKLILDQGYFPNGGLTATAEELKKDVLMIKEMGFNGARKHQKIEDYRYMYLCDKIGLVMWAEFPSSFEYSPIANENTLREFHAFIKKHYNHPSVICYTLLNESWGINEVYTNKLEQNFINGLVYLTKSLDTTRLVVGNDGWEHSLTDILTIHDYNSDENSIRDSYKDIVVAANGSPSKTSNRHCLNEGYKYNGIPFMISEFGGVAYNTQESEEDNAWGYGERIIGKEAVLAKIKALHEAVMDIEGVCGFCYTQLSDVEQEINGLLDHNHEYKFDPKDIRKILQYKHNLGFIFK